jgi:hypothetical protein
MGGFQSIKTEAGWTGRAPSGSQTRTAAALLTAALLCSAGRVTAESPSQAERPSPAQAANPVAATDEGTTVAAAKARVSMSVAAHAGSPTPPSAVMRTTGTGNDQPPLTRAAARQRVDGISPAAWLARFGLVSIERRE